MDKLKIIGLEGTASGLTVEVQFNPKEISIDKSVPWQRQKTKAAGDLEFTAAEPMTLSCELMFDGFESGAALAFAPSHHRALAPQVAWPSITTPRSRH